MTFRSLKMIPLGCLWTSVSRSPETWYQTPENWRHQAHDCGSLRTRS